MKERGMLFTGDMVRAILDGEKTQTRRPINPQPPRWSWSTVQTDSESVNVSLNDDRDYFVKPPYGKPGDVIYVRETHYVWSAGNKDGAGLRVDYRASEPDAPVGCWTPSIHMPRWASRIDLPIVNVRVERIRDITEEDARAEGCTRDDDPFWVPSYNDPDSGGGPSFRNTFEFLWEATYPGSWERNDWVWVYEWNQIKVKP